MKPIVVRISRKQWSRAQKGKSLGANALLVTRGTIERSRPLFEDEIKPKAGTMCCLGFACLAMGLKKRDIRDIGLPSRVGKLIQGLTEKWPGGGYTDKMWVTRAAQVNDDPSLSSREREKLLRENAADNGFKFVFVP